MRVLVVGSGGREHAIAWKLAHEPHVDVVSAPGNPGMAALGRTVPIAAHDLEGLASFAEDDRIDLAVIGPEIPLVGGIADLFASRGLKVFGPSQAAAQIEGSKVFCRELARRRGVPIAQGESFEDPDAAADCARTIGSRIVVKADGLAAGKGVLICETPADAVNAINRIMREEIFGAAGRRVIVEEFLEGRESSIFCVTDGATRVILEPAQDYKRALDGDAGLNTGGMGAYSPVAWLAPGVRDQAITEVVMPLLDGLAEEGRPFRGCFYAGLMFTEEGPRLIEVNARFGDPETQVLMPRLRSNLSEVLAACADGDLASVPIEWTSDASVTVVVASGGYPGAYDTGVDIAGIEEAEALDGVTVFHAGTTLEGERLVSAGGRVLNVTAVAGTIRAARERAYEGVSKIRMPGMHSRSDISLDADRQGLRAKTP